MTDKSKVSRAILDDLAKMKRELDKAQIKPSYAIFYDQETAEFVMQKLEDYSETILQEESRTQAEEGKV